MDGRIKYCATLQFKKSGAREFCITNGPCSKQPMITRMERLLQCQSPLSGVRRASFFPIRLERHPLITSSEVNDHLISGRLPHVEQPHRKSEVKICTTLRDPNVRMSIENGRWNLCNNATHFSHFIRVRLIC